VNGEDGWRRVRRFRWNVERAIEPLAAMQGFLQLRAILDDPPVHRRVIHVDASCKHEFFDVTRTQRVGNIPPHIREENILGKMGSLEAHRHRYSPSLFTVDDRGRSYPKGPWSNLLSSLLPKGDALLHGGSHRAGKCGLVVEQGIIRRSHNGVETHLQVSQMVQFTVYMCTIEKTQQCA